MKKVLASILLFFLLLISFTLLETAKAEDGDVLHNLSLLVKGPGSLDVLQHTASGEDITSVCESSCTLTFASGDRITLTPNAKRGASFAAWSGNTCSRQENECSFIIDLGSSSQDVYLEASFEYLNQTKPLLKKRKRLTSKALMLRVACGGEAPCLLEISGKLLAKREIPFKRKTISIAAGKSRVINVLAGASNRSIRNELKIYVKERKKAKMKIYLQDQDSRKSARMAINEKPPCCPWPKKNKGNQ